MFFSLLSSPRWLMMGMVFLTLSWVKIPFISTSPAKYLVLKRWESVLSYGLINLFWCVLIELFYSLSKKYSRTCNTLLQCAFSFSIYAVLLEFFVSTCINLITHDPRIPYSISLNAFKHKENMWPRIIFTHVVPCNSCKMMICVP